VENGGSGGGKSSDDKRRGATNAVVAVAVRSVAAATSKHFTAHRFSRFPPLFQREK